MGFAGEIAEQQQEQRRPVVLFHAQPLLLMGTLEDAAQKCMACIVHGRVGESQRGNKTLKKAAFVGICFEAGH